MKWFPGSITDAVTTSKQRKAIFVVFIEGKDETSLEVGRAINGSEISSRLERNDFVAIRLESDTESYKFFTQIYQVTQVPCLFFIGANGVPLEIVAGSVSSSNLATKIDTILGKINQTAGSSSSLIEAEKNIASTTNVAKPSVSNAEVSSPASLPEKSISSEEPKSDVTAEEKMERAKALIELQRKEKLEKEREEEKKREIERRQLGKDVQMAKQKQHEAEIKMAYDERMKEKAAEAAARERVRQQIAQDKLERKQKEMALQQQVAQQQQTNQQERVEPSIGSSTSDGTTVRIQFRLPSGSPHMGKFDATSTLGSLRSYVAGNIELPFQQFAMSTTFPRRDLSAEDDDKTLTELELVPTAVILILPVKNSKVTTVASSNEDVGFVSRFIWALFAPIVSVYNYVMGYFSGAPSSPPERRRSDGNVMAGGMPENAERFGRVVGQPSGSISRNLLGGPSTTIRSRGNIHRLHSGGDDNDENNTWNGNSTQQM